MKHKKHKERMNPISDAIFGAAEDMNIADAVENLEDAGIDPEELVRRTYERLSVLARAYRTRREEVPPLLKKALDELRPNTAPARTSQELEQRVAARISQVLNAVRSTFAVTPNLSDIVLTKGFRNKAVQGSDKDQKIIKRLENELLADLGKEEKEH